MMLIELKMKCVQCLRYEAIEKKEKNKRHNSINDQLNDKNSVF